MTQHPSPPPFNLLAFLYNLVAGIVRAVLWVVSRCQGVPTASAEDLLDSEAQRLRTLILTLTPYPSPLTPHPSPLTPDL